MPILARTDGAALRNESPQIAFVGTVLALVYICVCVCVFETLTHLAASVPHFLRIIVG